MPTLIVAADADRRLPSHYAEVFTLLDGWLCATADGWARACERAGTRSPSFPA